MATPESDSFVRSFARGLRVIEVMGQGSDLHTVASVAAGTGLPRTVVRRILMTLTELGFTATDGKNFRLTPKILSLGMSYLTSLPFWGIAQSVLEDLCAEVKESVALSVFDGSNMLIVLRVPSRKVMSLRVGVGTRLPAYATSSGRVLLAGLGDEALEQHLATLAIRRFTAKTPATADAIRDTVLAAREQGCAWADAEFDPAICGLAVPVRDAAGNVAAAVNVNLLSGEMTQAKAMRQYLRPLRAAAEQLRAVAPQFLSAVSHVDGSAARPLRIGAAG
jgi:IclR family pca regulon transcriptional regulator